MVMPLSGAGRRGEIKIIHIVKFTVDGFSVNERKGENEGTTTPVDHFSEVNASPDPVLHRLIFFVVNTHKDDPGSRLVSQSVTA